MYQLSMKAGSSAGRCSCRMTTGLEWQGPFHDSVSSDIRYQLNVTSRMLMVSPRLGLKAPTRLRHRLVALK